MEENEQNQEENQNQETQQQQTESDTTPQSSVQVNPEEIHGLYRGVLSEANQRTRLLEQQLEELRNQRATQNQPTPEEDVELLTTNPAELIRREIEKSMAPLNQQAQEWNRTNQIERYKNTLRNDPRFPFFKYNEFMPVFENTLSQIPQLNDSSVYAGYLASVGMFVQSPDYAKLIAQPANQPNQIQNQPTHHNQTVPTPPSNRPAPPQRVPSNNNVPKKVYSENEKLLMRINNMTEEQWEAELALAPNQVITGGQSNV